MTLAIRVQNHPDRDRHLDYLLQGLEVGDYRMNYLGIVTTKEGTWYACKEVLNDIASDDTHVLVLQDDTLPYKDLIEAAKQIATIAGDHPVTLFTNNPRAQGSMSMGHRWMTMRVWFMAQAYIVSRAFISEFLEWDAQHAVGGRMADDEHLALYCYANNIPVYATIPSLVEHLGWRTTTIDERRPNKRYLDVSRRVASTFLGFENSAMDIDWSEGFDTPFVDKTGSWDIFSNWYKD